MAFDQSSIVAVNPPQIKGTKLYISWQSTSPAGTWFQLYANGQLTWWGQRQYVWLPIPTGPERIDIGTVLPGEEQTDFSASLPSAPKRRVTLSWQGGMFEGADLAGFFVYGSPSPGQSIDFGTPLANITAYPAGLLVTGFGVGNFGMDGFGSPDLDSYSWQSGPLASGTWNFAVAPYDQAGNQGTAQLTTATILAPPSTPPPFADGSRLHYVIDRFGTGTGFGQGGFGLTGGGFAQVTLSWNASTP